jgi:hypothetical protein
VASTKPLKSFPPSSNRLAPLERSPSLASLTPRRWRIAENGKIHRLLRRLL